MREHALEMALRDERAELRERIEAGADAQPLGRRREFRDHPLEAALLHVDPRARGAHLPLVEEDALRGALRGRFGIGVVEDDQRRLAAQFEREARHPVDRHMADALADLDRAGKGDLVDAGVRDERRARLRAAARDDVEHAGRQARLLRKLAEP